MKLILTQFRLAFLKFMFRKAQRILLSRYGFVMAQPLATVGRPRLIDVGEKPDYVRFSSLELVAYEIKSRNTEGEIAELGVYTGEFAAKLNELFPDRRLYLFDTFEGFDTADLAHDAKVGLVSHPQDFSDTSVDFVLSRMPHPEACVVKKGCFPRTAAGVDARFAFVHIDADLYNPVLDGLKFFYPRLSRGGYIFVHDYNNSQYRGAMTAVRTFCDANEIGYFPLCDFCGSAVISK